MGAGRAHRWRRPPSNHFEKLSGRLAGWHSIRVNERWRLALCNDRRAVTADTALMLARAFGNSAEFWLNLQRRSDLWVALNTPERRARINRAKPVGRAA